MTPGTLLLFGVVVLLALNHLPFAGGRKPPAALFWGLQLLNLAAASLLVTWGLPEFQGRLRVVNLLLGGLLVLHIVQNNRRYRALLLERRREDDRIVEEVARRIRPARNGRDGP